MSINGVVDKEDAVHIYNEMLLRHQKKKNEIITFVPTWVDLESIILSEVSQTKTNAM